MNAQEKLLSYISSLTPEQVEKIIMNLPKLTSLLEDSNHQKLQKKNR